MKKFKVILAIVLSAILALAVVGCGGGRDPSGGKTDTKTIEIWISTVNQPKYFMGWFKNAFERENEGITLKFTPSTNIGSGLDVTLDGADAPDMVATSGGLVVPTLKAGNRILSLESVVGPIKSTFHETALLNQIDNEFWCAPIFGFSSPVIYYNKTVFDNNGWTAPTTYDALVDLCKDIKALKNKNGEQMYQTIVSGYSYHILQAMTGKTMTEEQLSALIADKTSDAANPLNNAGMENALKWVEKMRQDGIYATNFTGYTTTQSASDFATQKALMIMAPGLDLLDLSETSTFTIGSFSLPDAPAAFSQEGVQTGSVAGIYNDCLVINSKTKYAEECKKVIEFMYSEAAQQELFNCFLYPVVKTTSYENVDSSIKSLFDSAFKPIYDKARDNGMTIFWMNYFYKTGMDSGCEQAFKSILNGTKTVSEALSQLASNW